MSFYLTGNPVPSASMPDVHDNAQNLDFALNEITSTFWTDRLGRRRMSWFGIESAFTMKLTDFESRFDSRLAEQESVFAESLVDKENRFQQFLGDSGYVFLGDYEDGPFQFSARNQYIRFQNQFYRLNKSTDTGFTTTGTDETSFANDVTHLVLMDGDTLRQNLGSGDGAKLVGGIGFVSPEMFGYLHGVTPDAVPYFQAAVDEGHARGLPVQLTGKYYATTYPHKVTLPGDDGTAYPGWVTAGNDANIAAEPENHIYAAIRLYPDSVIIGDSMQNCALIGDWDSDTPVINNNQHIGYFISGDSSDGYIRPQLVNHGVRNFFIGRYGNGVLDRSTEDNFLIRDCCLTGWFMGADSVCNGFVVARDCFTGDAYGGAWTQRNAAVTIPYLPPYPAAEIFKVGWVDAIRYTKYHFYGKPRLFGPADEAIDTWFDTYIHKSANSARTSAGGRLTNNTASGYSARSFPGIAGRAFTVLSRYGRAVNGVCLDDVKVLGTHRVPFYTDAGSYNVIHTSYVEKTCLVDTTTTTIAGNQFYTDYQDPWNATLTKAPAMVCEGGITVDRTVVSAGVATHPFSQKPTTINGPLIINPFRDDTEDYSAVQIAEWNSAEGKTVYLYDFRRQYSVQRPIRFFENTQETFQYYKGVWTPVVKCGSDVVTLNTTVGTYRRSGRLVHATFRIETTSMALTTGGAVVISGLPFTVAALSDGGLTVSPIICSRAGSGIILAQTNPTTKDILLLTNSSPAALSITGGTGLTIYGSVQYVLTE
nr:MAG TPA: tailspike protein [Caudoviricetes sp.]